MSRDAALWTGILAGPIVWLISFEANFALAPWACVFQWKLALYLVSIAALAVSAGSGILAWRQWTALGKEWPGDGGGALPRSRVMAIWGVLLSAMFFLVILAQAIPEVMLGACE
ncbi:MAG: hypothetical protein WB992_05210 [Bryobacteraceae bacterium]